MERGVKFCVFAGESVDGLVENGIFARGGLDGVRGLDCPLGAKLRGQTFQPMRCGFHAGEIARFRGAVQLRQEPRSIFFHAEPRHRAEHGPSTADGREEGVTIHGRHGGRAAGGHASVR